MPKGGARPGAGRKPLPKEMAYLDAVKAGAPLGEVTKAVKAVLVRAQAGDPKALTAVLQYLVPALSANAGEETFREYLESVNKFVNGDQSGPAASP